MRKLNTSVLIAIVVATLFCAFKVFIKNDIQPFLSFLIVGILSSIQFFSLELLKEKGKQDYYFLTSVSYIMLIVMAGIHYFPFVLGLVWNFAFVMLILQLTYIIGKRLRERELLFANIARWTLNTVSLFFIVILIFQFSSKIYFTLLAYALTFTSALVLISFLLGLKPKQSQNT